MVTGTTGANFTLINAAFRADSRFWSPGEYTGSRLGTIPYDNYARHGVEFAM
jgi:hypothetical protein